MHGQSGSEWAKTRTERPSAERIEKLAVHESAHAAVQWNLGFGVERIWIDRIRDCGHSQPSRAIGSQDGRIGRTVVSVAGLAAVKLHSEDVTPEDIVRSFRDFQSALCGFLGTEVLTQGEQFGLALALTRRAVPLVQTEPVQKQIWSLTAPLIRSGCLLGHQVNRILGGMPDSAEARLRCRELVQELRRNRADIVAGVRGFAPEFRWNGPPVASGQGAS